MFIIVHFPFKYAECNIFKKVDESMKCPFDVLCVA